MIVCLRSPGGNHIRAYKTQHIFFKIVLLGTEQLNTFSTGYDEYQVEIKSVGFDGILEFISAIYFKMLQRIRRALLRFIAIIAVV